MGLGQGLGMLRAGTLVVRVSGVRARSRDAACREAKKGNGNKRLGSGKQRGGPFLKNKEKL